MSRALTKAIRQSEMIGEAAFDATLQRKAAGGAMDFVPSGAEAGLAGWQDQQRYADRYNLFRGWIYSAINVLASEGAGQPIVVARLKGAKGGRSPKGRKALDLLRMTKTARSKTATTEHEILEDHPLKELLDSPNTMQDKWQFVYSFIANLCLTGWSFVVVGQHKGKLEVYCLPTNWVKPIHEHGAFSKFAVKNPKKVGVEPTILDRSQVGFAHIPNPSDPLSALAPAAAQMMAIRVDDHIQTSQEAFFRNGIFPSVVITVGKSEFTESGGRPTLTGAQRRQLFGVISKAWGGVANQGKPAIVDGLIEKIERLSATHNEMGWQRSEDKVRTRILSAFGVHPYILGEHMPGSNAQAYTIEKRFYKRVNTFLDMLSNLLTNLLGGVEQDEKLLIWMEECQAVDPSRRDKMVLALRTNNDISQNEARAEVGFPPDEDLNQGVIQSTMMTGVGQVLTLLGGGQIQRAQAQATLELMGIPEDGAAKVSGKGLPEPELPPPPEPPKPPAGEEKPEKPEEEEEAEAVEELRRANLLLKKVMEPRRVADEILESVGCC